MRLFDRVQVSSGQGVLKNSRVTLVAADPRTYSSALKTAEVLLSAGTNQPNGARQANLSVTNAGTTGSPPIIRIDGPIVNPVFTTSTGPPDWTSRA